MIEPLGAERPARRREAGFTLLEVLIALALLGGALVTLELVATTAVFRQASRENETLAQGLAQETIERALVAPVTQVQTPFESPFERFTREVMLTPWTGAPDLEEVVVTIRWTGLAGEESLRVHTLVAAE
jgi:prepilin-type N-terminal cleavage/methylation domain-containing protein